MVCSSILAHTNLRSESLLVQKACKRKQLTCRNSLVFLSLRSLRSLRLNNCMKAAEKPTSVWLIEDHDDFRKAVAWQINQIEGMRCTHHYATAEQALQALEAEGKPQVVLCDIGLPGMDGIS